MAILYLFIQKLSNTMSTENEEESVSISMEELRKNINMPMIIIKKEKDEKDTEA